MPRSIIEASREESFEVDAENVVGPRVLVIAQTLEPIGERTKARRSISIRLAPATARSLAMAILDAAKRADSGGES